MSPPETDFDRYLSTGDESSFRALVNGHLPMVLSVAQRQLGEHGHLAADVAQGVFTRLARVARGLPQGLIAAAWLHRQTVRLAIDTVRTESRRRSRETTAAMLNAPNLPAAVPPWEHLAPVLDEMLNRLPATDRAALVLRYLEDRDFAEVGRLLGSTPEAARKRIARGLEKLRILLAQRGVTLSISALASTLLSNKASAASPVLAATISQTAFSSLSAGWNSGLLLTFVKSNMPAVGLGMAVILLVAAQLYFHQRRHIIMRLSNDFTPASGGLVATGGLLIGPGQTLRAKTAMLTLDEIIEALSRIAQGPDSRLAGLRTDALLSLVEPEQYGDFFRKGINRIRQPRWESIVSNASNRWSTIDPEALTKGLVEADNQNLDVIRARITPKTIYWLNTLETQWFANGEGKMEVRPFGFGEWVDRDYEKAIQWLESQRDTSLMQLTMMDNITFYESLLRFAAARGPANAPTSRLERLARASHDPSTFMRAAVVEAPQDPRPLKEILGEVQEPSRIRALVCNAAVMRAEECFDLIRSYGPDSTVAFEAALGIVAQPMRRTTEGSYLTPSDRVANAQFALDYAGALQKSVALQFIVESWFAKGVQNDHCDLIEWVCSVASREEYAGALETGRRIFAKNIHYLNVALDFTARMPESEHRNALIRGTLLRMRDADPRQAMLNLREAPNQTKAVLQSLTLIDAP